MEYNSKPKAMITVTPGKWQSVFYPINLLNLPAGRQACQLINLSTSQLLPHFISPLYLCCHLLHNDK